MSDPPTVDERARFEALWNASYPQVLAYARRRFSEEDARDIAADTFLVAWRRRADLPTDDPVPWLYGVARRVASDRRRSAIRQSRLTQRLVSQRPAEASSPPDPERARLLEALAMLGERDREALLLVGWEGLSLGPRRPRRPWAAPRRLSRAPSSRAPAPSWPAGGRRARPVRRRRPIAPYPRKRAPVTAAELDQLLVGANPVSLVDPDQGHDARARIDRERVWMTLRADASRPKRTRLRRPLVIATAALLLAGVASGGALVVSSQLKDPGATRPGWAAIDIPGAKLLGRLGDVAYFEAAGASSGSRCLVSADALTGDLLTSNCSAAGQIAEQGGMVTVQRRGDFYLVAGLVPEGITGAIASDGQRLAAKDGFVSGVVASAPGVSVRVFGPGAAAAAAALGPVPKASYRAEGPEGPSYEVLITPIG